MSDYEAVLQRLQRAHAEAAEAARASNATQANAYTDPGHLVLGGLFGAAEPQQPRPQASGDLAQLNLQQPQALHLGQLPNSIHGQPVSQALGLLGDSSQLPQGGSRQLPPSMLAGAKRTAATAPQQDEGPSKRQHQDQLMQFLNAQEGYGSSPPAAIVAARQMLQQKAPQQWQQQQQPQQQQPQQQQQQPQQQQQQQQAGRQLPPSMQRQRRPDDIIDLSESPSSAAAQAAPHATGAAPPLTQPLLQWQDALARNGQAAAPLGGANSGSAAASLGPFGLSSRLSGGVYVQPGSSGQMHRHVTSGMPAGLQGLSGLRAHAATAAGISPEVAALFPEASKRFSAMQQQQQPHGLLPSASRLLPPSLLGATGGLERTSRELSGLQFGAGFGVGLMGGSSLFGALPSFSGQLHQGPTITSGGPSGAPGPGSGLGAEALAGDTGSGPVGIGAGGGAAGATAAPAADRLAPASERGYLRPSGDEVQRAVKAVLEGLAITGDQEREPPEMALAVPMLRHQKLALSWMCRRERSRKVSGGILADDQGLGKTVTTIALIVTHARDAPYMQGAASSGSSDDGEEQQRRAGGTLAGKGGGGGGGGGGRTAPAGSQSSVVIIDDDDEVDDDDAVIDLDSSSDEAPDGPSAALPGGPFSAAQQEAVAASSDSDVEFVCESFGAATGGGPGLAGLGLPPLPGAPRMKPEQRQRLHSQQQQQQQEGDEQQLGLLAKQQQSGQQPGMAVPCGDGHQQGDPGRAGGPAEVALQQQTQPQDQQQAAGQQQQQAAGQQQQQAAGQQQQQPWDSALQEDAPVAPPHASSPAAPAPLPSGQPPSAPPALPPVPAAAAAKPSSGRRRKPKAKQDQELERQLLEGGTLVVCPTSLLHQWGRELQTKVHPGCGCTVHQYHGKDKVRSVGVMSMFTVVLTTYGTLASEAPLKHREAAKAKKQGGASTPIDLSLDPWSAEDGGGGGGGARSGSAGSSRLSGGSEPGGGRRKQQATQEGGPLFQVRWQRVVLDEAQSIKNARTLAAHAVWALEARHRWCLSGTPIQNNVDDLFSYFRFLRYSPFDQPKYFKAHIKDAIAPSLPRGRAEAGYRRLQATLRAVLLRRTKQTTIDGKPIVSLPPRKQEVMKAEFSKEEREFYDGVEAEAAKQLAAMEREAAEGGGGRRYMNMLHLLLKLRQACNHPWLVRGGGERYGRAPGAPSAAERAAAARLPADQRAAMLAALSSSDAQCPACADVPEEPSVARCGHVYCRQCAAAQLDAAGGERDSEFPCGACGCAVRGADVYTQAALEAVSQPPAASAGAAAGGGAGSGGSSGGGSGGGLAPGPAWQSSTKVDRLLSLLDAVRRANAPPPPPPAAAGNVLAVRSKMDRALSSRFRRASPPAARPPAPAPSPAAAGAGPSRGASPSPPAPGGPLPDKVLVFSQWTSMLDLLEAPLKARGVSFRRLDGSMTIAQRERAVLDFESDGAVLVLLVSLKAAALGLNLVAANHVVLMDLWWNPTVEEQAIDRAHRIGQTRAVNVTRITIPGTVEDRIMELQDEKRKLIDAALAEGGAGGSGAARLNMDDLLFLFTGSRRGG